jgi:hypothetical protein
MATNKGGTDTLTTSKKFRVSMMSLSMTLNARLRASCVSNSKIQSSLNGPSITTSSSTKMYPPQRAIGGLSSSHQKHFYIELIDGK